MELRKLVFVEQFSSAVSSKRKVVSGFSVVFVASLLVFTTLSLKTPFRISILNPPMFKGFNSSSISWFFPVPNTSVSLTLSAADFQKSMDSWQRREDEMDNEKTHEGNFSEKADKGNSLSKEDGISQNTHERDIPENGNNVSFLNFDVGERVTERTQGGNVPGKNDEKSSFSKEGMTEKTHESDFPENVKNASFSVKQKRIAEKKNENGGARVAEKTYEGNIIDKDRNATFPVKEDKITETNHAGTSEKDKIAIFYNGSASLERVGSFSGKCDIFNGRWVRDEGKPYYPAGSCPHIDKDFNCYENGRPDIEFLRWRWQPKDCNIPSLNATDFLEKLRDKRLLFVGDSLNRNMWESLVCILRHSIVNKSRVHEMSGRKEFKTKGYYSFRYEDYNCSVDFVRSPFLVRESPFNDGNGVQETLRLDLMDEPTVVYREADVLVFNTGHWWTHEKTSRGEYYYQEGTYVYPMLNVKKAYKKALTTWARWVDKNIDANRTRIFFRGYSVSHFSGGQWNSGGQCHNETEPIFNETYLGKYPWKMKTLEDVLKQMQTPITYMNISRLTDYRKDGHPSIYRKEYQTDQHTQDCSHWCLPGVPDTWNELLYASLVMDG